MNSLKVPKTKKILLYEMKFLVPNYNCLQDPWLGCYRPQIPVLAVLCPQLNLLTPPSPRTIFLGRPLADINFAFEDPTGQTYVTMIAATFLSISDVYKRYAVVWRGVAWCGVVFYIHSYGCSSIWHRGRGAVEHVIYLAAATLKFSRLALLSLFPSHVHNPLQIFPSTSVRSISFSTHTQNRHTSRVTHVSIFVS